MIFIDSDSGWISGIAFKVCDRVRHSACALKAFLQLLITLDLICGADKVNNAIWLSVYSEYFREVSKDSQIYIKLYDRCY